MSRTLLSSLISGKRIMDTSSEVVKEQQKNNDTGTPAVIERYETVSKEIPITVLGYNQQWTFHCDEHQPLANTLFIPLENLVDGKCMLFYDATTGNQMLDRTKTPAFYGMIYDDTVYLGGVKHLSD